MVFTDWGRSIFGMVGNAVILGGSRLGSVSSLWALEADRGPHLGRFVWSVGG